jgi:cell division protein FtsL
MIDFSSPHKYKLRGTRRRTLLPTLLLILLAFLMFYLLIWQSVQVTHLGYRVAELQLQKRALKTLQQQLKVEVNRLSAPNRIAKLGECFGLKEKLPDIVFLKIDEPSLKREKKVVVSSSPWQDLRRFSKKLFGDMAEAETVEDGE